MTPTYQPNKKISTSKQIRETETQSLNKSHPHHGTTGGKFKTPCIFLSTKGSDPYLTPHLLTLSPKRWTPQNIQLRKPVEFACLISTRLLQTQRKSLKSQCGLTVVIPLEQRQQLKHNDSFQKRGLFSHASSCIPRNRLLFQHI